MKILIVLLGVLVMLTAGCATGSRSGTASSSPNSPAGTDVGASFPGVNQPTTTTTATRSDNPTPEQPNTRR